MSSTVHQYLRYFPSSLIKILQESADKSSLCITNSVKYSPTFRWAFHNESIHQSVLLLLRSYVTDLYDIFSIHINKKRTLNVFFSPFSMIVVMQLNQIFGKYVPIYGKIGNQRMGLLKMILKITLRIFIVIINKQVLMNLC